MDAGSRPYNPGDRFLIPIIVQYNHIYSLGNDQSGFQITTNFNQAWKEQREIERQRTQEGGNSEIRRAAYTTTIDRYSKHQGIARHTIPGKQEDRQSKTDEIEVRSCENMSRGGINKEGERSGRY